MTDFYDDDEREVPVSETPDGASILVNGSYQRLETGAPFLNSVKSIALQAGFGKFKVYLNGTEVRPSSAPSEVASDMRVEIRPYDEAG